MVSRSSAVSSVLATCICLVISSAFAADTSLEGRSRLVTEWYRQFLAREPGAVEVKQWADNLERMPYAEAAKSFLQTPEAQVQAFRRIATRVLKKFPENYLTLFRQGAAERKSVRREALVLLCQVPELVGAGPDTPQARVNAIHRAVLGRDATLVEREGWTLLMRHGMTPLSVGFELLRADEGVIARARAAWREAQEREVLPHELPQLVGKMRGASVEEDIIAVAMTSAEYESRRCQKR